MAIKELLGKRILIIRKSKKLTQEQLAEKIGIDTSSISNIENGRYYPSAENLEKLLCVLEITPNELFQLDNLNNQNILIDEMIKDMKKNEKLTRLMYKFYQTIKFEK